MNNTEHAQAMERLKRVLIDNADKITEEDVRDLLSSVGVDYELAKAKYNSK